MAFSASEASVRIPRTRGLGLIFSLAVLIAILPLAACIMHKPNSGGQSQIVVTVTASTPTAVPVSTTGAPSTVQLSASVTGTSNTAVTWSLQAASVLGVNCTASGTQLGSFVANGSSVTYTAPNSIPSSPCGIAVVATSAEDTTVTGQALVKVQAILTLSPNTNTSLPVSTTTASTLSMTATITGIANTGVTWGLTSVAVSGTSCPATGSGLGSIPGSGNNVTYTAPSNVPVSPCGVAITATSAADSTLSAQELVNVHVAVTISPTANSITQGSETIGQGANLQYSATVWGAPSGETGVVWNAACPTCQSQQTGGAFDANNAGLYIAPGFEQGTTQVATNITATSNFDPTQSATTAITVLGNDPLGTVSPTTAAAAEITCPTFSAGLTGATCYQLQVSCDQIADWTAYLKVNPAPSSGTLLGTVIFETGEGGVNLYDNDPEFIGTNDGGPFNGGDTVVNGVWGTGYTTVQVSFGGPFNTNSSVANGWLQGPGGVRRLACRYATVADWVYRNIHNSNTNLPYCATGNGSGAAAIGYAATVYPQVAEFSLIEVTGGPLMTRLHWGCNQCGGSFVGSNPCTQESGVNMCYSTSGSGDGTSGMIDAAYQAVGQNTPQLCTNAVNGVEVGGVLDPNFNRFQSDSIEWESGGDSEPLPIPDPPTDIGLVFGTMDTTNAVPQGYAWWQGVSPQPPKAVCKADASIDVPLVLDGANQIIQDIQNNCKLH
jgi:hypothetical protein